MSDTQTHLPPVQHSAPWLSPSLTLGLVHQPPHVLDGSPQRKLEDRCINEPLRTQSAFKNKLSTSIVLQQWNTTQYNSS